MTDLTKITEPFGLLSRTAKQKLIDYDGRIECYAVGGWKDVVVLSFDFAWDLTYRAKATRITKPSIPWDSLDKRWLTAARDYDGALFLYAGAPVRDGASWVGGTGSLKCKMVTNLFDGGTCDWSISLVSRGGPK